MQPRKFVIGALALLAGGCLFFWFSHGPATRQRASLTSLSSRGGVAATGVLPVLQTSPPVKPAFVPGKSNRLAATTDTPHSHPAWVNVLLTNGAASFSYLELVAQPVSREVVDALLKRFDELPRVPFTNKFGIAAALAAVGDERVVELFRRVLFEDYRSQHLEFNDGLYLTSLLILAGDLATRYPQALALLREGLNEEFWETNITWSMDDAIPVAEALVKRCIRGSAMSGREDAWEWVLVKKREGDSKYLARHASEMVSSAAMRRYLIDHGRAYFLTNSVLELFERWTETPEGKEWWRWSARIQGLPEP